MPHVVHGNRSFETLVALARFPEVPAVFGCHNWETWLADPPSTAESDATSGSTAPAFTGFGL
jgi:hypothetical protein